MTNQQSPDEKIARWLGWVPMPEFYIDDIWTKGDLVAGTSELIFTNSIDAWHTHGVFDEIERRGLWEKFIKRVCNKLDKGIFGAGEIDCWAAYFEMVSAPASVLADALVEVI